MKEGKVYYTRIREDITGRNMEHIIGEQLLKEAIRLGYGLNLDREPRSRGEYGKPFFCLQPKLHYNISHSKRWVYCILAPIEVGIDVQEHRVLHMERVLKRVVPEEMLPQILEAPDKEAQFFKQWVLRESYVKWTGEGLSRDLRSLPLEKVWQTMFSPEEGYSGAVCCAEPLSLTWEELEINLPERKTK